MSWSVLSPPPVHILAQLLKITTTLSEVISLVVALHIVPVVPILLCDGTIDVHIATHANDCHIHRSDVHVMHLYLRVGGNNILGTGIKANPVDCNFLIFFPNPNPTIAHLTF